MDADGNVLDLYVYSEKDHVPSYMVRNGTTYRYVTDHRGSVKMVVNTDTDAVVQEIEYTAYGEVVTDSNPGFQPFYYAGGMYDQDTMLIRFGARDYDPSTGSWIQRDPIRFDGGMNLYGYVGGDPVNMIDVTGLAPGDLFNTIDELIADIENYLINEAPIEIRKQAKLYEFMAEIIDVKCDDGSVCYYYEEPYPNDPPLHDFVALKGANPNINNGLPERYIYSLWHSHVFYPNVFQGSEKFSSNDLILGSKLKGGIYMSYFMTDPETDFTWVSFTKHYSQ